MIVTDRDLLWAFMNTRLGIPLSEDFRAIGKVHSDCLKAVVAYNGFTGRSCFMHSAIDDPSVIDRTFVQAIFQYPFDQCGCTHVLAMVSSNNKQALSIDRRCGFREVHRMVGAGLEGEDLILLQMQRHECRYLRNSHGKEERAPAAELHGDREPAGSDQPGFDQPADCSQPA